MKKVFSDGNSGDVREEDDKDVKGAGDGAKDSQSQRQTKKRSISAKASQIDIQAK